ncbi:MAG: DUF3667 domain-containing protein [Gelidibacter sp.]
MKNLFADFSQQFLNYDNTFLRTFLTLFKNPENVIDGYINGTRKKYVNAITYFAIALTLSGIQIFILNKFFPETMSPESMSLKGMKGMKQEDLKIMEDYQSILYMLMVPIYALISKLVFLNIKKFNYTEHVVINMYLIAHVSIVSSMLVVLATSIGVIYMTSVLTLLAFQVLYSAYAFKRLFKTTLKSIILKSLIFLVILVFVIMLIAVVYAVDMYLNGDLQQTLESGKAASGN